MDIHVHSTRLTARSSKHCSQIDVNVHIFTKVIRRQPVTWLLQTNEYSCPLIVRSSVHHSQVGKNLHIMCHLSDKPIKGWVISELQKGELSWRLLCLGLICLEVELTWGWFVMSMTCLEDDLSPNPAICALKLPRCRNSFSARVKYCYSIRNIIQWLTSVYIVSWFLVYNALLSLALRILSIWCLHASVVDRQLLQLFLCRDLSRDHGEKGTLALYLPCDLTLYNVYILSTSVMAMNLSLSCYV